MLTACDSIFISLEQSQASRGTWAISGDSDLGSGQPEYIYYHNYHIRNMLLLFVHSKNIPWAYNMCQA